MDRRLEGLQQLAGAISAIREEMVENVTCNRAFLNQVHLIECLLRAADLMRIGIEDFTEDELKGRCKKIHDIFGAPGDWGYQTQIGDALRKIYGC